MRTLSLVGGQETIPVLRHELSSAQAQAARAAVEERRLFLVLPTSRPVCMLSILALKITAKE